MHFSILGGGRWGCALASHLGRLGHKILVFEKNPTIIDLINTVNHPYVEGVELKGVQATHDLEEALNFSDYIILALPVQVIREVLKGKSLRG